MKGNERKAECKSEKTYCKFVGAGLRTCPQKGITLIALIITIIVMLILVGLTINAALNGGLFTQAQTATKETQIEADREQLLSAVVASYETETGVISKVKLVSNLGDKWQVDGEGPYTVTSPKGNKFTVDENGTIEYKEKHTDGGGTSEGNNTVPEELAKYILGADGEGKSLFGEYDEDDNLIGGILGDEDYIFKQNPTDLESTIHEDVKMAYLDMDESAIYIRYKRNVYKFKINMENYSTAKGSLEKVNTPEGNLGKYVTYQGKTWIVLYDDSEKVELISADALGNVTLGGSDFSTAKTSYNNLIETLTQACKDSTGITTGIRNVGGPVEEPETPTYVTLNDLKTKGFVPQSDKETEINELIADIKQEDDNYKKDCEQMMKLGILCPDTPADYWISSRSIEYNDYSKKIYFSIKDFYFGEGMVEDVYMFDLMDDARTYPHLDDYHMIRPVITLEAGILNGKTEAGTRANPINLD